MSFDDTVRLEFCIFFFNDTATTEIYTLSLHDALPIWLALLVAGGAEAARVGRGRGAPRLTDLLALRLAARAAERAAQDRKSTRLNSSHANISYAVFCLKKKKTKSSKCSIQDHMSKVVH